MKNIEILESKKIIDYEFAINYMEEKLREVKNNTAKELIWFLEHPSNYTSGRGNPVNQSYINKIPIYNSGRGGKITWHGPGQRIIYFIIDLKKRGLDIEDLLTILKNLL